MSKDNLYPTEHDKRMFANRVLQVVLASGKSHVVGNAEVDEAIDLVLGIDARCAKRMQGIAANG